MVQASGSGGGIERYPSPAACARTRRLDRRPLGGSLVIFTPFCSTDTGNTWVGMDVSQRRKSLDTLLGSMPSQMRSSSGIHDAARWQFCRTHTDTHARA